MIIANIIRNYARLPRGYLVNLTGRLTNATRIFFPVITPSPSIRDLHFDRSSSSYGAQALQSSFVKDHTYMS